MDAIKVYRLQSTYILLKISASALISIILVWFYNEPLELSSSIWVEAILRSSALLTGSAFCGYAAVTILRWRYFEVKISSTGIYYQDWLCGRKHISERWEDVFKVYEDSRGSVYSANGRNFVLLASLPHYVGLIDELNSHCQLTADIASVNSIDLQEAEKAVEDGNTAQAVQILQLQSGLTRSSAISIVLPLSFAQQRTRRPVKSDELVLARANFLIFLIWLVLTLFLAVNTHTR